MATEKQPFGINVTVEVTDFTHQLLVGAGWTPPGQVHPVPPPRQSGAPHYQGDWVTLAHHEAALSALEDAHRRALDRLRRDAERLKAAHAAELRAARIKSSAAIRAEVAEEIAQDLASQVGKGALSESDVRFAAHVARRHAKPPQELPPLTSPGLICTMCYHLVSQHGRNGCSVITGSEALCRCREGHNR